MMAYEVVRVRRDEDGGCTLWVAPVERPGVSRDTRGRLEWVFVAGVLFWTGLFWLVGLVLW